jgi:hypothetical protein
MWPNGCRRQVRSVCARHSLNAPSFFQGKAVTLICDNRLSVKRTAGTVPLLPDPQIVPTYPGAKP